MRATRFVLAAALAVSAACSGNPGPQPAGPRSDSRTVTATDLEAATQTNLYDFILAYRPRWLQGSGPTRVGGGTGLSVAVFLDNQNIGGPAQLRSFSLSGIEVLRFYTAAEAQARFNVRDVGALIQIVTKK